MACPYFFCPELIETSAVCVVYRVFELDPNQTQQFICAQLNPEPAEIQKVATEEKQPF